MSRRKLARKSVYHSNEDLDSLLYCPLYIRNANFSIVVMLYDSIDTGSDNSKLLSAVRTQANDTKSITNKKFSMKTHFIEANRVSLFIGVCVQLILMLSRSSFILIKTKLILSYLNVVCAVKING